MEAKKNILTRKGLETLEEELQELKVNRRKEVAEKIKEAREQGDLSENAEYDAAKDEQRDIETRITEIEKILKNVEVFDEDEIDLGKISIGCTVSVMDMDYDEEMVGKFDGLLAESGLDLKLRNIFPAVLVAGDEAGCLTEAGAALLDETGILAAGIPLCPPEGDAGTGMTATNSVAPRTGNLSAGTSTFAMVVLEKQLRKLHREIDMVTTPSGFPCAMSHANNGTTDLNAWVGIFREFCDLMGIKADTGDLFGKLYTHSLEGDPDCGGLLAYGYYSGENITFINEGRPLFARTPNSKFNLANFMRTHLYGAIGVLKIGNDILLKEENVKVDRITGHGGYFKTKGVGQRMLAAALNSPISVMETAGEGGAWGIALLAAYLVNNDKKQSLADYLEETVFAGDAGVEIAPTKEDVAGFNRYIESYKRGLAIEKAAVENK